MLIQLCIVKSGIYLRKKQNNVVHFIIERAKEARDTGIRPSSWVQSTFGISRQQATRYFSELVGRGILERRGRGRGTYYLYAENKRTVLRGETKIDDSAGNGSPLTSNQLNLTLVSLSPFPARNLEISSFLQNAVRELVNNSVQYSQGRNARYEIFLEDDSAILHVGDDGMGIFQNIMERFRCASAIEAAAELIKGARMAKLGDSVGLSQLIWQTDFSTIEANGLKLKLSGGSGDWSLNHVTDRKPGTSLTLEIDLPSFQESESSKLIGRNLQSKILLPIAAWRPESQSRNLDRRDAKRMFNGISGTSHVILDFRRVESINHSFVQYIFVEFKAIHPQVGLMPVNLSPNVRTMINLVSGVSNRRQSQSKHNLRASRKAES